MFIKSKNYFCIGILAGQQQFGKERGYDFPAVLEWFAERVDRILILFDAHKLDISDEFKKVLDAMKQYEEKVMTKRRKLANLILAFIEEQDPESIKYFSCFRLE